MRVDFMVSHCWGLWRQSCALCFFISRAALFVDWRRGLEDCRATAYREGLPPRPVPRWLLYPAAAPMGGAAANEGSLLRRARPQRRAVPLWLFRGRAANSPLTSQKKWPQPRSMGRANCREFNVAWVWGSVPQLELVPCLSQGRSRSAWGRGANSDLTRNIRRHQRWPAGTHQCCHSHSPN